MIYSLRGQLIHTEPWLAVIECGGVGYACRTTMSTLSRIRGRGDDSKEVRLYTYMQTREDAVTLFGFASKEELSCFELLISVSGVGPKAAIAILSDLSPERFALTVAAGDSKGLTRTKGIGVKIAQRIVLELKDKLSAGMSEQGESSVPMVSHSDGVFSEALAALQVLGYSGAEAAAAINSAPKDSTVEDLVKLALKTFARL